MSSIALLSGLYNREKTKPKQKIRLVFSILIAVLALILVAEIVFHFVISPRLRLSKVEIIAGEGVSLSNTEILTLAGLKGDETFFAVDEAVIAERIGTFAPVKSVTVERVFPNTLKIGITERTPLGISLLVVDGRSVPVILDEEGVVFQIGSSVTEFDLPVLSGFIFKEVELGQRVNRGLLSFFQDLHALRNGSAALFSLISELKFVKKDRAGFEVLLYPRDYRVAVWIGSQIDVDVMRKILLVLDVFANQGTVSTIEEIDFRTGAPLVRFKEG